MARYMCRQKGEHIDIADTSEFLSKLGADERAVIVVSGDVAGDPSPLPGAGERGIKCAASTGCRVFRASNSSF